MMIDIVVNGKPEATPAQSLSDLLALMALGEASVATAVNGAFVPAVARGGQRLAAGDRVEIVSARQGG